METIYVLLQIVVVVAANKSPGNSHNLYYQHYRQDVEAAKKNFIAKKGNKSNIYFNNYIKNILPYRPFFRRPLFGVIFATGVNKGRR